MFFLFILTIVIILFITLCTSKLGIEIENLIINTEESKGKRINKDSNIYVYLIVLKKVKLFKRDIKSIKFLKNKDIDFKFFKNKDIKIDYKNILRILPPINIEEIDLNVQLSTEDAAFTAVIIGVISSILGIILKKPKYEIIPIYSNKNLVKIKLNCIIIVNLMQYICKIISSKIKNLGRNSINKKVEV